MWRSCIATFTAAIHNSQAVETNYASVNSCMNENRRNSLSLHTHIHPHKYFKKLMENEIKWKGDFGTIFQTHIFFSQCAFSSNFWRSFAIMDFTFLRQDENIFELYLLPNFWSNILFHHSRKKYFLKESKNRTRKTQ